MLNLEKEGILQVAYTQSFLWALNKKGEVFQYTIDKKLDENKEIADV